MASDDEAQLRLERLRQEIAPMLAKIEADGRAQRLATERKEKLARGPRWRDRLRRMWKRTVSRLLMRLAFYRWDCRARLRANEQERAERRWAAELARLEKRLHAHEAARSAALPEDLREAQRAVQALRHQVLQARAAADRWEEWAKEAVLAGRDDLAREALTLRNAWQRRAARWQISVEIHQAALDDVANWP